MDMISLGLCISASSLLASYYYFYLRKQNPYASLPLPPGPKGWPIIGNLLDMPSEFGWKTYHEWCKQFDTDILHIPVMGTNIIVLDSREAVTELLERRSSTYSDRARMTMANELMQGSFLIGFMPYGDHWRKHRRLAHHFLHPAAALRLRPRELRATRNMLQRFLEYPEDVMENLHYMAGETIVSIAYGLPVQQKDDIYIQTAKQGTHPLEAAAVPGAFLVDTLPWLKYVPEWMPGAGFRKKAKEWGALATQMVNLPFADAKKGIAEGTVAPSFTSISLQKVEEGIEDEAYQESVIRASAATMFAAGSDTTVSAITSCILGLLEYPYIMRKAQAELDSVIKPGQLPDFDDEENLPYITALTMETFRWRDVSPIAIPRCLQVDDEYKGYRIPKGSIVIPNAWAMLHDESVYPEPFTFKPERFLTKDGKIDKTVRDPRHACFGFGRRICLGRYMAFSSVWIAIASILYSFNIEKAKDEEGNIIEPSHEYLSAFVVVPKPFKCSVKPRSERHEQTIRSAVLQHQFEAA